jgi:hypothetical protein
MLRKVYGSAALSGVKGILAAEFSEEPGADREKP